MNKKSHPYRFTAKEWDEETKLYYMSARYQNPVSSRWMSADPKGFELINPMERNQEGKLQPKSNFSVIESNNWYSYVANSPMKYVDPTGNELWSAIFVEVSSSAIASVGNSDDSLAKGYGYSNATFTNLKTGRSFTREYIFEVTGAKGDSESHLDSAMASIGSAIEVGMVVGDFEENMTNDQIADSFLGEFYADTVAGGPVMGSKIDSDSWEGGSIGLTAGAGGGYAEITTDYQYMGKEENKGQRKGLVEWIYDFISKDNPDE